MSEPILAGSLASVIDLADNPPDQPLHSLTKDLQQPLVLYIARVPGSHGICSPLLNANDDWLMGILDVFLTTMKPHEKVVTAQDVRSSLYYMHLDRPEDGELLDSLGSSDDPSDDEDGHQKRANPTGTSDIRRKPLPPRPMAGSPDSLLPSPEVSSYLHTCPNGPTGSPKAERKAFSQESVVKHRRIDVSPPLSDRKLLGPRPMNQRYLSVLNPPLNDVPEKQNIDLRSWAEQPARTPPKLPPRPFSGSRDSVPIVPPRPLGTSLRDASVANTGRSRGIKRKPVAHPTSRDLNKEIKNGLNDQEIKSTSLSLIRRYNNEQWNVGKISSKGTQTTISRFVESSHEISIRIMTEGYLRFIDSSNSLAKQAVTVTDKSHRSCDGHTPTMAADEQPCFQRHLQVSGLTTSQSQRHRPEPTDSTFDYHGTRLSFDVPRHSQQSSDTTESHRSFTNGPPELRSGSKKAYMLRSPWGICEFKTGVAGRSFKCKHSYTSSDGPGMHSALVSELRFNLPSSKALGSSTGSKGVVPGSPREVKRSSLFLPPHQRRSSSSFEAQNTDGRGYLAPKVELEERLDLSLGQEHAGGGFGGKQAKLGKLVIENEGLQMLDLIVAANMALWWRVYERFT